MNIDSIHNGVVIDHIAAGYGLELDIIGFVGPNITLNIIKRGVLVEQKKMLPPPELNGVLKCKNPRCITSTEQELPHVFRLTDAEKRVYRCIYCETQAE